jgi:acyl phosphate:glycerol-3-phosphate acyltransferase
MEIIFTVVLCLVAFFLGAIPFSVIIGRWTLRKDIRQYGDGNPGAANVFRAGGKKEGALALLLDVIKGIPIVFISHTFFGLPNLAVIVIAISAVLGHAFSPFLHWKGGKAVAVTFGVMLGLPSFDVLLAFIVFVLIGFFLIEVDAWKIVFGAVATTVYLLIAKGASWEVLFMVPIMAILVIKHFESLHTLPHFRGLLFRWFQVIRRNAMFLF